MRLAFLAPVTLALTSAGFATAQTSSHLHASASSTAIGFEVKEIPLGKTLPGFLEQTLVVSRDGKRVAYVAGEASSKAFPDPAPPWYPVTIVMAERKGALRAVVDGVAGKSYPGVGVPVFSSDGKRLVHAVQRKTMGILFGQMVVVEGVEGKVYLAVGQPVFSHDGRRLAYRAQDTGRHWRMVVDGSEGDKYDFISTDPIFSPDDKGVAYVAWRSKKALLVNGANVAPPLVAEFAGDVAFSSDGTRLAYKASRSSGSFVVVDGHEGPAYDRLGLLVFAPDSRLAYAARRGEESFTVTEGVEVQPHTGYRQVGDPVFSPDGRHVAYWANDGSAERVLLDGAAGKTYDEIGRLAFGPNGRHLAYEARLGSKWRLVVDGVDGPEYQPVRGFAVERDWRQVYRSGWVFEGPDFLWYVTARDGELVRLEVQITPSHDVTP